MNEMMVPQGWKESTLKQIADKNDHYSLTGGPFGSDLKSEEYTSEGVRIIQLQNIGDGFFLNSCLARLSYAMTSAPFCL